MRAHGCRVEEPAVAHDLEGPAMALSPHQSPHLAAPPAARQLADLAPTAPLAAPPAGHDGAPTAPRLVAAHRLGAPSEPSATSSGWSDAGVVPPAAGHGQEHTAGPTATPSAGHTAPGADGGVSAVRKGLFQADRDADSSLVPTLTDRGVEHELRILQLLACTRVATPDQLHAWLTPSATDTSTIRRHLNRMRTAGLTNKNKGRRPHIWFLTEAGLAEARRAGLAAHRTTAVSGQGVAASLAFGHALAVTATAIAASRNLAPDTPHGTALAEVGDWEVEVAHPLGSEGLLVSDAVLHLKFSNLPHAFVEVDRSSKSLGKLISQVASYDRYRTHRTAGARTANSGRGGLHWRGRYPRAGYQFPPVLVVLADKAPAVLAARRRYVLDGIGHLPGVRGRQLAVAVTTLAAIQDHGALSGIWYSPRAKDTARRLSRAVGEVEGSS
jgi:hypothetical protein